MDQRRFRSLGVAVTLAVTLAVNARALIAAFLGHYSPEYVLARYIAGLLVGYIGMRIMESILFRPKKKQETELDGSNRSSSPGSSSTAPGFAVASDPEEAVN